MPTPILLRGHAFIRGFSVGAWAPTDRGCRRVPRPVVIRRWQQAVLAVSTQAHHRLRHFVNAAGEKITRPGLLGTPGLVYWWTAWRVERGRFRSKFCVSLGRPTKSSSGKPEMRIPPIQPVLPYVARSARFSPYGPRLRSDGLLSDGLLSVGLLLGLLRKYRKGSQWDTQYGTLGQDDLDRS
jgi:hypothetical protein